MSAWSTPGGDDQRSRPGEEQRAPADPPSYAPAAPARAPRPTPYGVPAMPAPGAHPTPYAGPVYGTDPYGTPYASPPAAAPYGPPQPGPSVPAPYGAPYAGPSAAGPYGVGPSTSAPYGASPYGAPPYGTPYGPLGPYGGPMPYGSKPPMTSGWRGGTVTLIVLSAMLAFGSLGSGLPSMIIAIIAMRRAPTDGRSATRLAKVGWVCLGVEVALVAAFWVFVIVNGTVSFGNDPGGFPDPVQDV